MRGRRRGAIALVAVALVAGCTSRAAPAATAVLTVRVTDLPAGVDGDVHVTGPGLDRRLSASQDLRDIQPGRYTLVIEPVSADDATSYPAVERVEVEVPADQRTTATARYGIVVPETTTVLDADDLGLVSDVTGPVLVFAPDAPRVAELAPGQVLVTGIGPRTPQGLLRKVAAVSRGHEGVEVRTEPATLPDAVPVGELTAENLSFEDTTLPNLRRDAAMTGTVNAGFDLDAAGLAQGACGGTPSGNPLSGDIEVSWQPRFELDWRWQKFLGVPLRVKSARFVVGAEYFLSVSYAKTVAAACSIEVVKPDIPHVITTFTVLVGPVPVVVSVTLQAVAKAELRGEVSTDYALRTGQEVALGLEYQGGTVNPIVRVPESTEVTDLAATFDASAKIGLRTTLALYGVTGPYLDLTVGARAASTDHGVAGCVGLYGDIGWLFGTSDVSVEKSDVIALERQVFPRLFDECPLTEEPADTRKVLPHRKKVTLDDYRWMIGTWEREIDDPDGNKDNLKKETIVVAPDGHVSVITQYNLDLGYQEPIRCEGVLAYTDTGVLVVDTSAGPAEYLDVCHSSLDDQAIAYVPAAETGDEERLDWNSPVVGIHGFARIS